MAPADSRGLEAVAKTTPVAVRELAPADLEEALAWRMEVLGCVFAEDEPWDAEAQRTANQRYYEHTLGRTHRAFIASVNGEDAGCGALCLQEEMPSPDNPSGKNAYLMNVYTRPAFRSHGVGEAVVSRLIVAAREVGAGKIYLEATAMGEPLYASLGFVPIEGMMKLAQ